MENAQENLPVLQISQEKNALQELMQKEKETNIFPQDNIVTDSLFAEKDRRTVTEAKDVVEKAIYEHVHELIKASDQMQLLHDHIRYVIFKAGLTDEVQGWSIDVNIDKK